MKVFMCRLCGCNRACTKTKRKMKVFILGWLQSECIKTEGNEGFHVVLEWLQQEMHKNQRKITVFVIQTFKSQRKTNVFLSKSLNSLRKA